MLALSRKPGEVVRVTTPDGSEILVSVARIKGDRVVLGFAAPEDHLILRGELASGDRPRPVAA